MKRHWKKLVIGAVSLVILVLVGSFVYAKIINKADPAFSEDNVLEKLDATTTTAADPVDLSVPTPTSDGVSTTVAAPAGVDGTWAIAADSEVGYRVDESINGFATTANGRTNAVTGSIAIAGTTAQTGDFTVDMTTFKSDESRRDGQFNGRIMAVDQFPTATFVLTAPIDFGKIPAEGEIISTTASGDLTLHGTTKPVTFDLKATFKNNRIGVLGQIPVVFADYGIPNPSRATIATEDHGLLEFVLIFDKSA
jgi:polyisoprenoid-binding protein YceI